MPPGIFFLAQVFKGGVHSNSLVAQLFAFLLIAFFLVRQPDHVEGIGVFLINGQYLIPGINGILVFTAAVIGITHIINKFGILWSVV